MNTKSIIAACLIAALPATALADPHDNRGSAPHPSAPARSYQPSARSYQPRYTQSTYQRMAYTPRTSEYAPQHYAQRDERVFPSYGGRQPWVWNGGRVWAAAPGYWGGGFWGSLAIGLSFNDYVVQPSSPGAQLLANYGLQQTDCDQDNLVQIFGPDGSEICAYPNDEVGPGQYQVDPSTLSLVSG